MRRNLWQIKNLSPEAQKTAKQYNIPVLVAQVIINRNIEENFESFLNPTFEDLHAPDLLPDIEKAVERIKLAVSNNEKVLVFGDYDVDGITALAIFHEFAKNFPNIFSFYIPHRVNEGYGLRGESILKAKEGGINLIVAFDCGTNACQEISLANSLGIDIIIVDHHYPRENLSNAFAFINPKRKDCSYPFSDLSSGALSFKLLQILTGFDCRDCLDLVALSLVCDVAPLRGENRVLLKEGLKVIRESKRLSLKALFKAGSVKQNNINIFHIGYILGPRINASGRMDHAKHSLDLFLTKDESEASNIAFKLNEYNKLRKNVEQQILREAEESIKNNVNNDWAIVVSGEGWHQGVLGIVASRLANKYYRPSFVFSFDKEIGKGSARSIQNFQLMDILAKCNDHLLLYGGHSKAAGVHINRGELDNFKEKINFLIETSTTFQDFIPAIEIDAMISLSDIDMELVDNLDKIKPYGEGNQKPFFIAKGIFVKGVPKKIKSAFSVWFSDGFKTFEGIIYDKDILDILGQGGTFDIVFSPEKNYYHNIPKLIVKDCRIAEVNS